MRNYSFIGQLGAVLFLLPLVLIGCTSGSVPTPTATLVPTSTPVPAQGLIGDWSSTVTKEDLLRVMPDFHRNSLCENSGAFIWRFKPDGTFTVDQTALTGC